MAVKEASAARPPARERLLAAANELFYNEGVHTVGIDRVIEQAGVAKASLYNTFGSKDELVRAYLETRHASVTQRIMAAVHRYGTPRERLLAVFEGQAELFAQPDYRGCAFARASAESRPATWRSRPPRTTGAGYARCSPSWPRKPARPTPRPWPASSTCSTTAAACPRAWTTTRPRRRPPAARRRSCSTRPWPAAT